MSIYKNNIANHNKQCNINSNHFFMIMKNELLSACMLQLWTEIDQRNIAFDSQQEKRFNRCYQKAKSMAEYILLLSKEKSTSNIDDARQRCFCALVSSSWTWSTASLE